MVVRNLQPCQAGQSARAAPQHGQPTPVRPRARCCTVRDLPTACPCLGLTQSARRCQARGTQHLMSTSTWITTLAVAWRGATVPMQLPAFPESPYYDYVGGIILVLVVTFVLGE